MWQNSVNFGYETSPGANNVLGDPLFVDAARDEYRVYGNSPAVTLDAGAYAALSVTATPTVFGTPTATPWPYRITVSPIVKNAISSTGSGKRQESLWDSVTSAIGRLLGR